jgi:hypothetical protein
MTTPEIMILCGVYIALCIMYAVVLYNKGYQPFWKNLLIISIITPIIAKLIYRFIPENYNVLAVRLEKKGKLKVCPHCSRYILSAAIYCEHCHRNV